MSGFWRLTVRDQFSAAHALRNYHGKCESPHGHNFDVEASVEGVRLDPETGMLVDFAILKAALKTVLAELDHADLNNSPPFDAINPSSENLARHIGERLAVLLAECPDPQVKAARLTSVSVSEKATQTATWVIDN